MKNKLEYSPTQLYQNCLLKMCAHIAAIPKIPNISGEHSWDKINYSFHSSGTTDGTISFDVENNITVGALRCNTSKRILDYPAKRALDSFAEAGDAIRLLAENETLEYLLIRFEQKKSFFGIQKPDFAVPVVTTVFWNEGDDIFSSDNQCDFRKNGGEYIDEICVSEDRLLKFLIDDYELTDDEIKFAKRLFALKGSNGKKIEREFFSTFLNSGSEGYDEFVEALLNFGVAVI